MAKTNLPTYLVVQLADNGIETLGRIQEATNLQQACKIIEWGEYPEDSFRFYIRYDRHALALRKIKRLEERISRMAAF